MGRLLRNKRGLSTVVTTLIILVVSVLLATVVTYYAINVTTTRVTEEALQTPQAHVWVFCNTTCSQGALYVVNTGGRDVILDKITVRGVETPWSNIYYWKTNTVPVTHDLNATGCPINASSTQIMVEGQNRTFTQATGDICLKSGWGIVIYIDYPDTISCLDVGVNIGIVVHTANAMYYKEDIVDTV